MSTERQKLYDEIRLARSAWRFAKRFVHSRTIYLAHKRIGELVGQLQSLRFQSQPSESQTRPEPLIGKLVRSGDFTVNGEETTGYVVETDREALRDAYLPMLQPVIILKVKEWIALQRKIWFLEGAQNIDLEQELARLREENWKLRQPCTCEEIAKIRAERDEALRIAESYRLSCEQNSADTEAQHAASGDSSSSVLLVKSNDDSAWKEFASWWGPRHDGQEPSKDDPSASEAYQYYCAGSLDERQKWSLPHNVMETCLKQIHANLEEAAKVLSSPRAGDVS